VAALLALRFWHFGPAIDAPHDWRQCDTAYYIWDFYQNGIDLLHPAVCWMGKSDALALEFPLPEAVVALGYRIFGESMFVARLIFLFFFAGALYYFYKITCLLFGEQLARWATLVYLALPLSIFYSRAVHIDFAVVLLAHAMLYYYLVGVEKRSWKFLLLSSVAAALAFVVKAPYAFYFLLPMVFFAIQRKAFWWVVRFGGFYLLALGLFLLWRHHVNVINGAAPNWDYILHYRKMTQSAHWYFGSWQQRLSLYSWKTLFQRGVLEVAGIGGIVFFILGWRNLNQLTNWRFLLFWMLGLVAYVLIFFNLNFVHNYYQIPLLAPLAIICAKGLQTKPKMLYWFFGLLVATNVTYTEICYFKVSNEHLEIGQLIQQNTPGSALVIVTYQNMDCRNPKILYRARRRGWSVEEAALRPEVMERLHKEEGAGFWVYVGADLPQSQMHGYLASLPKPRVFKLTSVSQQLYIFNLSVKK
jgi:4-amino-4-deoxy-L-arabinose transferase-like glycosyltransferase